MVKKYTTIPVTVELFDKFYLLKAEFTKGERDKTWESFMMEVAKIIDDYIFNR